jgi:hypothetical protein
VAQVRRRAGQGLVNPARWHPGHQNLSVSHPPLRCITMRSSRLPTRHDQGSSEPVFGVNWGQVQARTVPASPLSAESSRKICRGAGMPFR